MSNATNPSVPARQPVALVPLAGLCLLVAVCHAPCTASAQDYTAVRAQAHGQGVGWYGWQLLISDASAFGLMALGSGLERPAVTAVGLGAYLLAPPIIHLVHGNGWALGSLVLRVAGPGLVIGGLALAINGCGFLSGEGECNRGNAVAGTILALGGIGLVLAMPVIDAVLAREALPRSDIAITPWLSPRADAGGLSVAGRL